MNTQEWFLYFRYVKIKEDELEATATPVTAGM